MAQILTDANFDQEVLKFPGVVMIDFWAEWCTPCKMIAPIVESLTQKFATNPGIKIAKLDVDNNPTTQSTYHVLSIPTLLFFKNGQLVKTIVGLKSPQEIEASLTALL